MRHRHELPDAQWARPAPLLPPQKPKRGRPSPRPPADGQCHALDPCHWRSLALTGAHWRDLPERYGPWQIVATRFYRWVRTVVWHRILAAVQQQGEAAGQLDWSALVVDRTSIRAHHAACAQRWKGAC